MGSPRGPEAKAAKGDRPARRKPAGQPAKRRRRARTEGVAELAALAGGRGDRRAVATLERAAAAFTGGRDREAARFLRPLRDAYPDAAAVRELLGLALYRLGYYTAAARELKAFVDLTQSVEQHPVLMDCLRAQKRYRAVDELWEELREVSPAAELVIEGRIVRAGSLADRGDVEGAIAVLARRAERPPAVVRDHHLRLWYALADLEERAGNLPRARALFEQVRRHEADFADVAERLSTLGRARG